jgi:hypothetical protein
MLPNPIARPEHALPVRLTFETTLLAAGSIREHTVNTTHPVLWGAVFILASKRLKRITFIPWARLNEPFPIR